MTPHEKSKKACLILTRAAGPDTPEENLWVSVVHTVVHDYFFWPLVNRQVDGKTVYHRIRPKRRQMQRYMNSSHFEQVCGYANLLPEFVQEVIERLELHEQ